MELLALKTRLEASYATTVGDEPAELGELSQVVSGGGS